MAILVVIALFVGVLIAAYVINGWALVYLWQWFIVPLGLPPLGISWAIGISVVIGFLTNHEIPRKDDKIDNTQLLISVFVRPLMALAVGYIVKHYL